MKSKHVVAGARAGALAIGLVLTNTVVAKAVSFSFNAQLVDINAFGDTSNLPDLGASLTIGQIIQGSFSYDLSASFTIDILSGSLAKATYEPATLSFNLPPLGSPSLLSKVSVRNVPFGFFDEVSIFSTGVNQLPGPPGHLISYRAGIGFTDFSAGTAVSSAFSLPTSYTLSDFDLTKFTIDLKDDFVGVNSVFGITSFEFELVDVVSDIATPVPATLPLFAGGLGVIVFLARRRKCRNAAD